MYKLSFIFALEISFCLTITELIMEPCHFHFGNIFSKKGQKYSAIPSRWGSFLLPKELWKAAAPQTSITVQLNDFG